MLLKLAVGEDIINVSSAYAPQVGLDEHAKRQFWDDLDVAMQEIHRGEKLITGGNLNRHVGKDGHG